MNPIHERVALPDPVAQPMIHPLDLSDSTAAYRRAWLYGLLGSPECLVLIGVMAWWATSGWIAPTLAVACTGGLAELARKYHLAEEWSHIPRRRQDQRSDPWSWQVGRSLATSTSLVAGVMVVLAGLSYRDVDPGILAYSLGACLGLGIAVLATGSLTWWSRRNASSLMILCSAVTSVLIGCAVVWASGWLPASPDGFTVVLGAGVVLALYMAWWRFASVR